MNEVTRDQILTEVQKMWDARTRFVTMTCTDCIDYFDLIYSFDHDMELVCFRARAEKEQSFPSISGIYFCAFLVENEIQDQFGIKFDNLALDYEGFLLLSRDAPRTPMLRKTRERGKNEDAV